MRDYWEKDPNISDDAIDSTFPTLRYGRFIARQHFEFILKYIQFSAAHNLDVQITDFITALNEHVASVFSPGNVVCLDESMVEVLP